MTAPNAEDTPCSFRILLGGSKNWQTVFQDSGLHGASLCHPSGKDLLLEHHYVTLQVKTFCKHLKPGSVLAGTQVLDRSWRSLKTFLPPIETVHKAQEGWRQCSASCCETAGVHVELARVAWTAHTPAVSRGIGRPYLRETSRGAPCKTSLESLIYNVVLDRPIIILRLFRNHHKTPFLNVNEKLRAKTPLISSMSRSAAKSTNTHKTTIRIIAAKTGRAVNTTAQGPCKKMCFTYCQNP